MGIGALLAPFAASADPFPTRDQNPLFAGFGIPQPLPSQLPSRGAWTFASTLNWASSAIVQSTANEALLVDAETRELRLIVGHALTDRWTIHLQLPYRHTGAGSLDGFIDGWHDFFGLPEGQRPLLARNAFRIAYENDGSIELDHRVGSEGLADLSADIGYQWLSTADASLAAWLSVKLPTGDADEFTGSGATDIALSLAGEHRFAQRWSTFAQLSVTALGNSDLRAIHQRDLVWSSVAGLGVDVWRGLEFKLQFDAHSAAFDNTELDYLGDVVALTVGGAWKFQSGWQLDFGVSEDIRVDASPDVVFVMGVRKATAR